MLQVAQVAVCLVLASIAARTQGVACDRTLFQTSKTGAPTEYGDIEATIAPVAVDTIAKWLLQR